MQTPVEGEVVFASEPERRPPLDLRSIARRIIPQEDLPGKVSMPLRRMSLMAMFASIAVAVILHVLPPEVKVNHWFFLIMAQDQEWVVRFADSLRQYTVIIDGSLAGASVVIMTLTLAFSTLDRSLSWLPDIVIGVGLLNFLVFLALVGVVLINALLWLGFGAMALAALYFLGMVAIYLTGQSRHRR